MKLDPVVRRETVYMASATLICTVLLQTGFFLLGKWDFSVLIGGIVGWIMTAGNFFLMSVNVQKAVECDDETQARLRMRASYTWRMSAMLGILILAFILDFIHWVPVMVAMFYPRLVITVRQLWQKYVLKTPEEIPTSAPAVDETEEDEEDEEDGFEKVLGHFAGKINTDYSSSASDKKEKESENNEKGRS